MTTCLRESGLQSYLEGSATNSLRLGVENHMVSCARCRTAFERVAATHRRVNRWLSELCPPAESDGIDVSIALLRIVTRREPIQVYRYSRGANPRALAFSLLLQAAIVALLMLMGTKEPALKTLAQTTLIVPPTLVRPVMKPVEAKPGAAGGGAQRSPLPPRKGELQRPALKVFTPPSVWVEHPALALGNPAPPDAWSAPIGIMGDPFGGLNTGVGLGKDAGTGPGRGIGNGPGNGDGSDGTFGIGNGITAPSVLSKVDPEYSEEARKAKYGGSVMLTIIVNTDGRAEGIRIVRSLGMGLDEKAVEAVQQWRFRPGTNKGEPVRVRAQVEINFRLL